MNLMNPPQKTCVRCRNNFTGNGTLCDFCISKIKELDAQMLEANQHPESTLMRCTIEREGATTVNFGQIRYVFEVNTHGHSVCEVKNLGHYEQLLRTPFYEAYDEAAYVVAAAEIEAYAEEAERVAAAEKKLVAEKLAAAEIEAYAEEAERVAAAEKKLVAEKLAAAEIEAYAEEAERVAAAETDKALDVDQAQLDLTETAVQDNQGGGQLPSDKKTPEHKPANNRRKKK